MQNPSVVAHPVEGGKLMSEREIKNSNHHRLLNAGSCLQICLRRIEGLAFVLTRPDLGELGKTPVMMYTSEHWPKRMEQKVFHLRYDVFQ